MEAIAHKNKMGTAPVFKLLISMSIPAIFSMLISSIYNVVDSIFVSKLGEEALTALSLAYPMQMFMIAVGVGTGIGANSLIARRLGAGNQKDADVAAVHGLVLAAVSSVVFVIFSLFFCDGFFRLFTQNPTVHKMGVDYLGTTALFAFVVIVQITIEKMIQATGNMIFPMLFGLTGAVINVILDPILIFGYFGFPKLGVLGAAVATVIGQAGALIFSIIALLWHQNGVNITLRGFRFRWKVAMSIYSVGLPSIIMQSITSVITTLMNLILGGYSETAIAVLGVYYKLQSFVFMPLFGLTQGLMPILGYNYGAGQKKRMTDALRLGAILGFGMMGFGFVLFQSLPGMLLSMFNASDELLEIGIPALRTISICFIPAAVSIVFSTTFQACGRGTYSLLISILRQLVIILPVAYLMSLTGVIHNVWWAYPIAESVSMVASICMMVYLYRSSIRDLVPVKQ